MKTLKFVRKPLGVEAVQVNADNLYDVAKWAGGLVLARGEKKYVCIDVLNPSSIRQTEAFEGDWVLQSNQGFKVYTEKAFEKGFEPVEGSEWPAKAVEAS